MVHATAMPLTTFGILYETDYFCSIKPIINIMYNLKSHIHNKVETSSLNRLKAAVERTLGRTLVTPVDFRLLSSEITAQSDNNESVSISTLKRIWGYVPSGHQPSTAVLSLLARFCGYRDWNNFMESAERDSGFLVMKPITPDQLNPDDIINITWAPDRVVSLRFVGNHEFEVIANINSKLRVGDKLQATIFCLGYPLYATNICRGAAIIPAYVAARKNGLLSVAKIEHKSDR